jgi:hypothetical protein
MNRLLAGVSTAAVSVALLAAAPWTAGAEETNAPVPATASCPDPAQIIDDEATIPQEVVVGIKKTKKMVLDVYADSDCAVTEASAIVDAPRKEYGVKLTKVGTINGYDHWQGSLSIAPRTLRNSDAGTWPTTYRVNGAGVDELTVDNKVLRASRLTFNAGPEPVRNSRITYSGKLERASWNRLRYYAWGGRTVSVVGFFEDHGVSKEVATPVTSAKGTYRHTQRVPGADEYSANVARSSTTAAAHSRTDHVS